MDIEKLESILLNKRFSELSPAEKEMVFAEVGTESDYEHLRETLLRVKTTFTAEASSVSAADDFKDALLRRFETSRPTRKAWFDRILEHVSENLKVYSLAGSMAILLLIFLVYNNTLNNNLTPEIAKVENKNTPSSPSANDYKTIENESITRNMAGKANEENQTKSIQAETKDLKTVSIQPNKPYSYEIANKIDDMEADKNPPVDILHPEAVQAAQIRDESRSKNLEEESTLQNEKIRADKLNKDNIAKKQGVIAEKQKSEGKTGAAKPEMASSTGLASTVSAAESIDGEQRFPVFQECSHLANAENNEKCFQENLYKYLNKKITLGVDEYQQLSGRVKIRLTVNKNGEIIEFECLNQINRGLEQKLKEAFKTLPNFKKPVTKSINLTCETSLDLNRLR